MIKKLSLFYSNWAFLLHVLYFTKILNYNTYFISLFVAVFGTLFSLWNIKNGIKIKYLLIEIILHYLPLYLFYKTNDIDNININFFMITFLTYIIYIYIYNKFDLITIYSNPYKFII